MPTARPPSSSTAAAQPPSPARRTRRKAARPAELLQAATQLFVEKGYAATRVEEVARLAQVSKGTLFLYYPSKEALLKAVVRESVADHFVRWQQELRDFEGSTPDMVRHAFQVWSEHIVHTPAGGICKLLAHECSNFPELGRFFLHEVVEPGHALVRYIVQRGIARGEFRPVNVDAGLHLILAPMFFFNQWKHSLGMQFPDSLGVGAQEFFDTHVDNLLRGLAAPCAP